MSLMIYKLHKICKAVGKCQWFIKVIVNGGHCQKNYYELYEQQKEIQLKYLTSN